MLKFDNPTLVTITAPTCSGKSYLLNKLTAGGGGRIVSTTTRDSREGEVDGRDYHFITRQQSIKMEGNDEFFELIEFRGTRYGVTHTEMSDKILGEFAPIVILEPKGLEIYERKCIENGWDIFKIYLHTVERERINRLNKRTAEEVLANCHAYSTRSKLYYSSTDSVYKEQYESVVPRIIQTHTDRLLSITTEERRWQNMNSWNAIVPGDNADKAIEMLLQGAKLRNRRRQPPQAIGAVNLPIC
jgi:guanylate kinase